MKLSIAEFHQAHSSNYSRGREQPIRYVTIHHSAGWEQTLRYLWANSARNGSSHFWVGNQPNAIEQYVDTDDTAWTNGNWRSNNESLTIEVRGDWRGYYNQPTLDNLGKLLYEIRKRFPNVQVEYHKDVSDRVTLCPAELKDKGYAKAVWDDVTKQLNPPQAPPTIPYRAITPKRVELVRATHLFDFSFKSWADYNKNRAKYDVKPFGQGTVLDVVAIAKNAVGQEYYMTAYSYNGGKIRATNGFNLKDCKDYVPEFTEPPTVEPKWEAFEKPRKMRLLTQSRVVNLDTMEPIGNIIPVGTDIDLATKKTTKDNVVWARSKWATQKDQNTGIQLDRFGEVPAPEPEPPREKVPEPPIDVDPEQPGNGDIITRLTALEKIVKVIVDFINDVFNTNIGVKK